MSTLSDIKEAIQGIANQDRGQRTNWHVGTVTRVDASGDTCSVRCEGAVWTGCRLCAVADSANDFHIVPRVGSMVVVADMSNGGMADLAVVLFSQVERMTFQDGKHTTANADVLKAELDKLTARVDALYDTFNSWTPVAQDGGSALKTQASAHLSGKPKEDWGDIQNDKIKHG